MGFRSIKSRVFFQLWILFFLALLFIDLVIFFIFLDRSISRYTNQKKTILKIACIHLFQEQVGIDNPEAFPQFLPDDSLFFTNGNSSETYGEKNDKSKKTLESEVYRTFKSGAEITKKVGRIFGFFLFQYETVIITFPVKKEGKIVAAAGISSSLEEIYIDFRRNQKIIFIFIVINSFIFAYFGKQQLARSYFRPLQRLAKRAETYKDETFPFFAVRKEDNDFSVLSSSLNKMLHRIADDKRTLKETIGSLEETNVELKKAQNEVIRAEKLATVGRLTSGIAHEIGNPIGIVLGYLDLLKQPDVEDDELLDFICRSEQEITRIHNIIRQLLDMSRDTAGEVKNISIHQILDDLISVFRYQPVADDIDFQNEFKASNDHILADPDRLRQVFLNLLLNAIDAVNISESNQKTILLKSENILADFHTQPRKKYIKVDIIDNGPGFSFIPSNQLFDPFFTTKEPGKGTGLGLSVAFMIVEKLKGRISACNADDKGAVFEVVLPLEER